MPVHVNRNLLLHIDFVAAAPDRMAVEKVEPAVGGEVAAVDDDGVVFSHAFVQVFLDVGDFGIDFQSVGEQLADIPAVFPAHGGDDPADGSEDETDEEEDADEETLGLDGADVFRIVVLVINGDDKNCLDLPKYSKAETIKYGITNTDVDFFTALDDFTIEGQEGSAHMGSLEFNSATYYRYVCLDLGQLAETLGIENRQSTEIQKAIEAFVKALYLAVPQARQHTLAGECGWDYAKVYIRKGQPLQYSCDEPVRYDSRKGGGYLQPSIAALNEFLSCKERMSGSLFGKLCEYELSAQQGTIDELIQVLQKAICYE